MNKKILLIQNLLSFFYFAFLSSKLNMHLVKKAENSTESCDCLIILCCKRSWISRVFKPRSLKKNNLKGDFFFIKEAVNAVER